MGLLLLSDDAAGGGGPPPDNDNNVTERLTVFTAPPLGLRVVSVAAQVQQWLQPARLTLFTTYPQGLQCMTVAATSGNTTATTHFIAPPASGERVAKFPLSRLRRTAKFPL